MHMAGGTTGNLRDGAHVAQETLLVGIEDRHQSHLRQVKTLTQEVYTNQHIEHAGTQILQNLHTLQRIDIGVDVAVADAHAVKIFRELLGHALRDGRHEHLLIALGTAVDLGNQVVDLTLRGAHLQRRIDQTRRADKLLDNNAFTLSQLPVGRRGTDIDRVALQHLKLREGEGSVIFGGGEAEAVLHQILLAGAVATKHGMHLGQCHMALIHHQEVILGEVVQQTEGARTGGTAVEVARIVLNARAVAQLLDHLQVVLHALLDALSLHRASLPFEVGNLLAQVEVDLLHGLVDALLGRDEEVGGVERDRVE